MSFVHKKYLSIILRRISFVTEFVQQKGDRHICLPCEQRSFLCIYVFYGVLTTTAVVLILVVVPVFVIVVSACAVLCWWWGCCGPGVDISFESTAFRSWLLSNEWTDTGLIFVISVLVVCVVDTTRGHVKRSVACPSPFLCPCPLWVRLVQYLTEINK